MTVFTIFRVACLFAIGLTAGCDTAAIVGDPYETLNTVPGTAKRQIAAMQMLDEVPDDATYVKQLNRMMSAPYYTVTVREAAFERLEQRDPEALQRTIRQTYPRLSADMHQWRTRLAELIAERNWTGLAPALVSSWARPFAIIDDADRPEYRALVTMFGKDQVPDLIFQMMVDSNRVTDQGLRGRCWELMHRLDMRDRLVELVANVQPDASDAMLLDLHAGATELGIVPWTREEILWLRSLRGPEYRSFWSQAKTAATMLSPERKSQLELRDLPIIVAVMNHEPELFTTPDHVIYEQIARRLREGKHYSHSSQLYEGGQSPPDRLGDHRKKLKWGDLAAMSMALKAMQVPQVASHLFDYAELDRADKSTEYGGVISLDQQGRFEVHEFVPAFRRHDNEYVASQDMLDSAYDSLFHFHFHVQRPRNDRYAGPGPGDNQYADTMRANCLVLTSVGSDQMNVDYYRHGRVAVDLGVVARP